LVGEFIVIGNNCAAVSKRTQVLARVETKLGCVALGTRTIAFVGGTVGLGGIFYHPQSVPMSEFDDLLHLFGRVLAVVVQHRNILTARA
jgi:hypothetical protein